MMSDSIYVKGDLAISFIINTLMYMNNSLGTATHFFINSVFLTESCIINNQISSFMIHVDYECRDS